MILHMFCLADPDRNEMGNMELDWMESVIGELGNVHGVGMADGE